MAIADVIKYEGDNSVFVYKHPSEDFNSLTQLIVHRSQEAVFMMNGQALDLFGPAVDGTVKRLKRNFQDRSFKRRGK